MTNVTSISMASASADGRADVAHGSTGSTSKSVASTQLGSGGNNLDFAPTRSAALPAGVGTTERERPVCGDCFQTPAKLKPLSSFEERLAKARSQISNTLSDLSDSKSQIELARENQKKLPQILDDLEQIAFEAKNHYDFKQGKVLDSLMQMTLFGTNERFAGLEDDDFVEPNSGDPHHHGFSNSSDPAGGAIASSSSMLAGGQNAASGILKAGESSSAGSSGAVKKKSKLQKLSFAD
ncbi:unnamed protein product [Amoebophrya sp. A120]|nr:unnamed protein product [Amoebophrya sp. A120]|eukprot:GSA120T00024652001.1